MKKTLLAIVIVALFIGIAIVILCQSNYFVKKISKPVLDYSNTTPEIIYPVLFIITYQIADMFDNSRSFVSFLGSILKTVFA